jgi:hypothetical protein
VGDVEHEVRVDPEPGDQEDLAALVVHVEVAPIVEVAVAGGDAVHGQRRLVDRIFVKRAWHWS